MNFNMERRPKAKQKRLLIDADIIAYKAAASAEKAINWYNGTWTLHAEESDVKVIIEEMIGSLLMRSGIKKCLLAITGKSNFRYGVLSSYKSNRKGTRRPMLLEFAKEYMNVVGEVKMYPTLEADDVLGILATTPSKYQEVIWSGDKDLKTIPGYHIDHETGKICEITEHDANLKWMMQTLTGDTTDGYKGCPGSGPKDAEKVLSSATTLDEMWEATVARFAKAGLTEQDALQQARVSRILHAPDFDIPTGNVQLWKPTKYVNDETEQLDSSTRNRTAHLAQSAGFKRTGGSATFQPLDDTVALSLFSSDF